MVEEQTEVDASMGADGGGGKVIFVVTEKLAKLGLTAKEKKV
jgi:hypothetical protein